jgi:16S rRNA (guanine966-N2)-methyltransferase
MGQTGYKIGFGMRITSGRFKGFRLPSPHLSGIRPSSDRVREAIFSILGPNTTDSLVLDLFAGTGALGFEALSRGAARVVFVEKLRTQAAIIKKIAVKLSVESHVEVFSTESISALRKLRDAGYGFSLVFLDPPYETDLLHKTFHDENLAGIVQNGGIVVVETSVRSGFRVSRAEYCLDLRRSYGETEIQVLRKIPIREDNLCL